MRNLYIIFILFLTPGCGRIAKQQAVSHEFTNACGPQQFKSLRTDVIHSQLNTLPYDALIHIGINNGEDWGTASYLSDSVLITARHVIEHDHLSKLQFYKNLFVDGHDQDIHTELAINSDFSYKVFDNVSGGWVNKDFAIIKLTKAGVQKTKRFFTSAFHLGSVFASLSADAVLHLSGYPFDLAGRGENATDLVNDKQIKAKEVLFQADSSLVGYQAYTCNGDSGAPLWTEVNGVFYILAVHHGGPEGITIFRQNSCNSGSFFNQDKVEKIKNAF